MMKPRFLFALSAALLICVTASTARAGDPAGTWAWKFSGQNGREIENKLTLKVDGEKLSGTLASGRQQRSTEITDGTFKNDEVSFTVTRERKGNKFTTQYKGKVEGDTIKGTITGTRPGGGQGRMRDWEAKREKA